MKSSTMNRHKGVWGVLQRLVENDEELLISCKALRRGIGKGVDPSKETFHDTERKELRLVGSATSTDMSPLQTLLTRVKIVSLEELGHGNRLSSTIQWNDVDEILSSMVYRFSSSWEETFGMLIKYRDEHNDRWPTTTEKDESDRKLGRWCKKQREAYRKNRLTQERIDKLENINFIFGKERGELWESNFTLLIKYRDEHNDRWPTQTEKDESDRKLGRWCKKQREAYRKNRLTQEQIGKLENINFIFGKERGELWESNFNLLTKCRDEHNDRWPTQTEKDESDRKLGRWCKKQREAYRKNRLTQERIDKLENINFIFGKERGELWESNFTLLIKHRDEHNDRWPTQTEKDESDRKLGRRCNDQRTACRKNRLTQEQIGRLEKINFLFQVHNENPKKQRAEENQ